MKQIGVFSIWWALRIPLVVVAIGVTIYMLTVTEPIATKNIFTGDDMTRMYNNREWLAGAQLVLLATALMQLIRVAVMKICLPSIKDKKEKESTKKSLAFELPLTIVLQSVILLTFIYTAYIIADWWPSRGIHGNGNMGIHLALTQTLLILFALCSPWLYKIYSLPYKKQNTP